MTAVHQLVPNFTGGDAIGHHALEVQRALRGAGYDSQIFAEAIAPEVRHAGTPWERIKKRGSADLFVYQASTGSPMTEFLLGRPEPLAVNYHNITPALYFERWEPGAAAAMRAARNQLRSLAARTDLAIAVSAYNAAELTDLGFPEPVVAPLLVDLDHLSQEPDPRAMAWLERSAAGGSRWLFVGRVAPNKCQHDVIAAFAAYRRLHDPAARLSLVGGFTAPLYRRSLEAMIEALGVAGAVDLTDTVSPAQLLAHYRSADVFVCLSEHEGFCVPIIEAMHLGVPVVAFEAAAVPDTVAQAGVLLPEKDPVLVAGAVHAVLRDPERVAALAAAGRARAAEFALPLTSARMVEVVGAHLAGSLR